MSSPRHRKERRAQAKEKTKTVPFAQPSRAVPTQKTLIDIVSERQLLDSPTSTPSSSLTTTTIHADGSLSESDPIPRDNAPDAESSSYLDIALYTFTLTMLHSTFTFLVQHQYGSHRPSLSSVLYRSVIATPTPAILFVLVALLHPRASHVATQLFFAAMSLGAGALLIHTSNEDAYMATMKKAPPLGTLWVWATLELRWELALACLSAVAGWGWYGGYTLV